MQYTEEVSAGGEVLLSQKNKPAVSKEFHKEGIPPSCSQPRETLAYSFKYNYMKGERLEELVSLPDCMKQTDLAV